MARLDSLRLDNNIVLKGRWVSSLDRLFDTNGKFSENAVSGNLELVDGHVRLDVNGRLNRSDDFDEPFKIYGYTSNGLYIILEKCYLISLNFSAPGYNVEKYSAYNAYALNFNTDLTELNEEIKASSIKFGINYLSDWLNVNLPKTESEDGINYKVSLRFYVSTL